MLQNGHKNQVVYETNADYFRSYEKLEDAKSTFVASLDQTKKGHIWFRLAGTETVFMLTPNGKLQVAWSDSKEKQGLFKIIRNLLVSKQGQTLEITPLHQQAFISYPPPKIFSLYWCEEETEYIKKTRGFQSESQRKRALKHSKDMLSSSNFRHGYDTIMPNIVIDKLAFQDLQEEAVKLAIDQVDRCVLQHLKSGYDEVYKTIQKYRKLMDETGFSTVEGFPKFRIPKTPLPKHEPIRGPLPHIFLQKQKFPSLSKYLDSKTENPEVAKRYRLPPNMPKEKIKKLLNIWNLVYAQICKILNSVEQDNPLHGSCNNCAS